MLKLRSYFVRQEIKNPHEFHKLPKIINIREGEEITKEEAEETLSRIIKKLRFHGISGSFSLRSKNQDGKEEEVKTITTVNHPIQPN